MDTKERVKVLHIIDSAGLYGAEIVLLNLSGEQKKMGYHPIIASIGEKGSYVKPLEEEAGRRGIDTVLFRMRNGPNFLGAWNMLNYARSSNINILHTHGYKGNILMGFIPKRFRKLPLVRTVHGWTNVTKFSRLRLYEWADGLSLKHADAVCLVNETMLAHPRFAGMRRDKLHIIPNGIPELDEIQPMQKDEIVEFCSNRFTIVSIGRLSKEKGYEYLLQAFAQIISNVPNARLLIIGEGPERTELEDTIRALGLTRKVMLPGYRENARRYLSYCRVFVLSSLTEGLPITLLEAMQTGIPVVATAVGGIPSVVKPTITGTLIPPSDPSLMSESILEIYMSYENATRAAERAKYLIREEYSSARMTQSYCELYKTLLNKNLVSYGEYNSKRQYQHRTH
jgi:glycosyltransferase involved in cell wall biosynthesis